MIEAVNSVISNSQVLKSAADQVDAARIDVASETNDISIPKAPFISPYIAVDLDSNRAILQIRDSETGDVVNQFPSEARLAQIRREQGERQVSLRDLPNPAEINLNPNATVQAQISIQEQSVGTPSVGLPQAQVASAALASAAQAGIGGSTTSVSA